MILRLFAAFRDLETLTADQAAQVEQLDTALRVEIQDHGILTREFERVQQSVTIETTRRIAAESIASERREEISRLVDQITELRTDLARVQADRLRSLDALNVRLMRDPVPETAPDMEQYKRSEGNAGPSQIVSRARRNQQIMDRALLEKLHPLFKKRIVMNEPGEVAEEVTA